ncbi:MAG TPA: hypothetical protein VD994_03710 [Prosthecobacter sp.]|nr:hypothetical protein [Prosthecobacter sp.]
MLTTNSPSHATAFRPGSSVVLANVPRSPVMTVLRHGVWGHRSWYIVAWLDHLCCRHEAFFPQEELLPIDPAALTS